MVFKLFSNVYVGKNEDLVNNLILEKYKIKYIICISDNNFFIENYNSISFGKTNESFYEILDASSANIQKAISENNNILICCDDGYTEIIPTIIYYLIRFLNMNFTNAQDFVLNHFSNNNFEYINKNKYLNRLRSKFIRESLLN